MLACCKKGSTKATAQCRSTRTQIKNKRRQLFPTSLAYAVSCSTELTGAGGRGLAYCQTMRPKQTLVKLTHKENLPLCVTVQCPARVSSFTRTNGDKGDFATNVE